MPPMSRRRAALLEAIASDLLLLVVLLLGGILCGLGVAATLHVLDERHRALELHSSGLTTTATVKKVHDDERHSSNIPYDLGAGYETQEVDVEFSDRHGRRHSATLHGVLTRGFVGLGYAEGYRAGNEVVLVYDRNDPDYADFADPCLGGGYACDSGATKLVADLLLPFVGVVIGIFCLVIGGLGLFENCRLVKGR